MALGLDIDYQYGSCNNWINEVFQKQGDEDYPYELVQGWNFEVAKPGDILIRTGCNWTENSDGTLHYDRNSGQSSGHAMLYLGIGNISSSNLEASGASNYIPAIAHASGHGSNVIVSNLTSPYNHAEHEDDGNSYYIVRIKDDIAEDLEETTNYTIESLKQNLNVKFSNPSTEFKEISTLNYETPEEESNIINYGKYEVQEKNNIVLSLSEIIDKILGFMMLVPKVVIIGWSGIIQNLFLTDLVELITGVPNSGTITVEKIVFNEVPLLDINFFNLKTAGGEVLQEDTVLYILRDSVSSWYGIFRMISIVLMLVILAYIAIRMAIASVGQEKAKYKKMFFDWLLGFVILFLIHYIMIILIELSQELINFIKTNVMFEESLYEQILLRAYDMRITIGLPATLMYIMLIIATVIYFLAYLKRFFTIFILTIFAPIVAISYALDRIKDGKSQAFNAWFREYTFNVLMQVMHAVIYVVFVSTSLKLALQGMGMSETGGAAIIDGVSSSGTGNILVGVWYIFQGIGCTIIALVFMFCSIKLEKIFREIFGFNGAGFLEDTTSLVALTALHGDASNIVTTTTSKYGGIIGKGFMFAPKVVAKGIGKGINKISNKVMPNQTKKIKQKMQKGYQTATNFGQNINAGINTYFKKESSFEEVEDEYEEIESFLSDLLKNYGKSNVKQSINGGNTATYVRNSDALDTIGILVGMLCGRIDKPDAGFMQNLHLKSIEDSSSLSSTKTLLDREGRFIIYDKEKGLISNKRHELEANSRELFKKKEEEFTDEDKIKFKNMVNNSLDNFKSEFIENIIKNDMQYLNDSSISGDTDVVYGYKNYVTSYINRHWEDIKNGRM